MSFDLLPGELFRSLIKLGFCSNAIEERICYDLMELVIGMDSKDIDEVVCETVFKTYDFNT